MDQNSYLEIDYLRAIAVILLVVWHCFFCTMFVWGVVSPQPDMMPFRILSAFFVVDAVMPLFTFISGYLFTALYTEKGKYRVFSAFVKNKVNRLLIPYIIFSLLIISTSYKLNYDNLLWGEGCHMWYCAMLFWCFMIGWGVKSLNNRVIGCLIMLISTSLVFAYPNFWFLPVQLPLGIDNGLYYYSYFALGGVFFMYRDKFKKCNLLILWGIYAILFLINIISLPIISRICSSIQTYIFSLALCLTIMRINETGKIKSNKKIKQLCKYSFGIYVFHHWLAWDLVWFPPISYILRAHYFLFPFFLTIIVFGLSYLLTGISFKTRLGRFLLL